MNSVAEIAAKSREKTEKSAPPQITAVPEHAKGDAKLLRKVLLEHYASTVFNVCECQELSKLPGPPFKLQVDPNAVPVACHKMRNEAIGVLESSDRPIWKFSFNRYRYRYRYAHHNIYRYRYRYRYEENKFTDTDTDTDQKNNKFTDTDADTDMKNC